MKIAGREIGPGHPPYIIAEISCNHRGDIREARALIAQAKQAGADAVKFQAYTADTITLDCDNPDFIIKDGPWKGRKLYELYSETQTPLDWFPALFDCARENDITAFASVFDRSSVDALEKLDCPAYKIASMEIVDIPLIKYAAKTGKPLIISTGMAHYGEIADAVDAGGGIDNVAVLHCISGYPSEVAESNLHRMSGLMNPRRHIGISDHTLGWEVPVAATALGACIIEKHLNLSPSNGSEDAAFSLAPIEFKLMTYKVRQIWQAMQPSEAKSEESSRQLRRSLYVVSDIKAGELFTEQNVRSIRPSYGLPPKNLPDILGQRASKDIKRGTALTWDLMEPLSSSPEDQDRSVMRS
jgi:pseudaminic acid synthase